MGEGTGSGLLIGDGTGQEAFPRENTDEIRIGTVYLGGLIPIKSSGTASGGGIVKGHEAASPITFIITNAFDRLGKYLC